MTLFKRPDPKAMPVYKPLRLLPKPKPVLRISHTMNAGGWKDTGDHLTATYESWRKR